MTTRPGVDLEQLHRRGRRGKAQISFCVTVPFQLAVSGPVPEQNPAREAVTTTSLTGALDDRLRRATWPSRAWPRPPPSPDRAPRLRPRFRHGPTSGISQDQGGGGEKLAAK